jgi:hypothetical protein
VLGLPQVLGYVPANVFTNLRHQQECLGLTDEELRAKVIAYPLALAGLRENQGEVGADDERFC